MEKAGYHWAPVHVICGHFHLASPVEWSDFLPGSSGIKRAGFRRPAVGAVVLFSAPHVPLVKQSQACPGSRGANAHPSCDERSIVEVCPSVTQCLSLGAGGYAAAYEAPVLMPGSEQVLTSRSCPASCSPRYYCCYTHHPTPSLPALQMCVCPRGPEGTTVRLA